MVKASWLQLIFIALVVVGVLVILFPGDNEQSGGGRYGSMRRSFINPYVSWFGDRLSHYFTYPFYRPYWFRNYGELEDPYFPNYYQTYNSDLPYFYYNQKSFDKYRQVWGKDRIGKRTVTYSPCRPKRHRPHRL